jgi:anti-sigma B factor antagonist
LRLEEQPHAVTALIQGEIDLSNAAVLQARLEAAVDEGRHVVVDLTDVTFLDLRGVEVLEAVHRRTKAHGRRMVLVASSPIVHRVLDIAEVFKAIPTADSTAQALELLSRS